MIKTEKSPFLLHFCKKMSVYAEILTKKCNFAVTNEQNDD